MIFRKTRLFYVLNLLQLQLGEIRYGEYINVSQDKPSTYTSPLILVYMKSLITMFYDLRRIVTCTFP